MKLVHQLLEAKGRDAWSVPPESSVFDAISMMTEKEVGALKVLADKKPVGFVSERDYARKVILVGCSSKDTPAHEIMTTQVICTKPN